MLVARKSSTVEESKKVTFQENKKRRNSLSALDNLKNKIDLEKRSEQAASLKSRAVDLTSIPIATKPKLSPQACSPRESENFPLIAEFFKEGQDFNGKMNELYAILTKFTEGKLLRKTSDMQLRQTEDKTLEWKKTKSKASKEENKDAIKQIILIIGVALDCGVQEFTLNKKLRSYEGEVIALMQIILKLCENKAARWVIKHDLQLEKTVFRIFLKCLHDETNRDVNGMLLLFNPLTNIQEALAVILDAIAVDQLFEVRSLQESAKKRLSKQDLETFFDRIGMDCSLLQEKEQRKELKKIIKNPSEILGYNGHTISSIKDFFGSKVEKLHKYVQDYLALTDFDFKEKDEDLKGYLSVCDYDNFINNKIKKSRLFADSAKEGAANCFKKFNSPS